jgi:RNA polymerase subunit RPABC4/transcription elongation factor Spt4
VEEGGMKVMAENDQTKVCPLCAETIKAAAKVCPFCQSRQGRFTVLKGELAGAFVVIVLLGGLIALGSWLFPDESDSTSKSNFIRHRDELPAVRTTLETAEMREQFWLSGFVTNKDGHPWRILGLEVRFLDAQSNLLEVQHREFDKINAFVVQPNSEHAFRIRLYNVPSSVTGVVQNVRVEFATDGRKYYNPD